MTDLLTDLPAGVDPVQHLKLGFLDEERAGCHPYNAQMAAWIRGKGERPESPLVLRPGEVLLFVARGQEAGAICLRCGTPLLDGMFAWDHRITTGPGYDGRPWQLGENRFPGLRHANGTDCSGEVHCYAAPRCGKCGLYHSLTTEQEAYGDRVTCRVCGDSNWYSIGD